MVATITSSRPKDDPAAILNNDLTAGQGQKSHHKWAGEPHLDAEGAREGNVRGEANHKIVSVRCGSSVLWLDLNSDLDSELDLLPQKQEIRRRDRNSANKMIKSGHDKQVRPRQQSKKYDFDC